MNPFPPCFSYLIHSNIFVSFAAVALSLETLVLQGFPLKIDATVFLVFFSTLFVYTISRVQLIAGVSFVDSLKRFPDKILAGLSFGGVLVALSQVAFAVIFLMAPLALISIGYALPIFKSKTHAFLLREIPMLKIFIISWVWGLATVLLPLLDKGIPVFNSGVFLILMRRMLYIFAITVPFDIRDQAEDARNSLRTLPGAFGSKGAKIFAATALLLFAILLLVQPNQTNYIIILNDFGIPLLLSAIVAGVFIYKTNPSRSKYYYLFFLDGTMILQFLLVYSWRCFLVR